MEEVTHKYTINKLIQKNDDSGTVVKVEYEVETVDGDYRSKVTDDIELNVSNIQNFVKYEDLTEEIVLQWIKDIHGDKNEIKNMIIIERQKNPPKPPTIEQPLPWA
jgi:hypothetical protein